MPFAPKAGTGQRGGGSVNYQTNETAEIWAVIVDASDINLYVGPSAKELGNGEVAYLSFSYHTAA